MTDKITLSTVQAVSAFFDKEAALEIALDWIKKAAKDKPDVIAFGEAWLPGYPYFIDSPLSETWWNAAAELLANCLLYTSPSPRDRG